LLFGCDIIEAMNLTKCDICGKKLKNKPVKAGIGYFADKDFCSKCGKPILDFLKKYKLLDEEK
jgi:rRNA maturation endonuclease Nob1